MKKEKKHKKPIEPKVEQKNEAAELKDRLLRTLADFDNYKKIQAREKEQFVKFANETIIIDLLPVVDNFARALAAAKDNEEIKKGLALIKKQLEDSLKKHGVAEIEALGKTYDPNFHEAILQKEADGPENINIEEVQKGYTLRGKVIRPTMVIVSKNKEEEKNV